MDVFLKLSPTLWNVLGLFFQASIISTIGPSFLTLGHLNIPRVLDGSYLRSGQLVIGKLVNALLFSNFRCICCRCRFW